MNPDKKIAQSDSAVPLTLFKIISATFIFSVIALGALAFSTAIPQGERYFEKTAGVLALNLLIVPAMIIMFCAITCFYKQTIKEADNVATRIAAVFTSAAATVPFIYYICDTVLNRISGNTDKQADFSLLLLAVTSVAVFLFSLSSLFDIGKVSTLLSGYCQVVFCVIIITKFYIDYTVELNSPVKLLLQFAAVAIMLSTVSDLRGIIGRPNAIYFVITKLFAASLPILYFVAFVAEIAPNIEKYSTEYAIFVPFFICYGISSTIKLMSFKLDTQTAEIEERTQEKDPEITADDTAEESTNATEDQVTDQDEASI